MTVKTKLTNIVLSGFLAFACISCAQNKPSSNAVEEKKDSSIDYMVLVNKNNPLPEGWEEKLETTHFTNTVGDDVEIETKAYDAYLKLKEDLEKEDVYVDLDNALRTVAKQQEIWDSFVERYGLSYTKKTVGKPGYSEHHTGLALDLYLIVDGENIVLNEEMVKYTDIWAKIHEKLADYGFILRYPEGKEHITGGGYEPWHIRYLDNVDVAKEITEKGITLEEYLGVAKTVDVKYDYGQSKLYTEEELKEAAVQVKVQFAGFGNCELHTLSYAGDEFNTEENIKWMNELDEGNNYTQVVKILTSFHTPKEGTESLNPDTEYENYEWWLARSEGGDWQLLTWGYN